MSINKYEQHLLILPEDDAYKDIANGFVNHVNFDKCRNKIKIEKPVGGWMKLLEHFSEAYATDVQKYPRRHVLLLLDFDGHPERKQNIREKIPSAIQDRVFFLSALDEAENIVSNFGGGHKESLGEKLAEDCYNGTHTSWSCPQLCHNKEELNRLAATVRPFLFNSAPPWQEAS